KKANQTADSNEKSRTKREGEAPRTTARPKVSKPQEQAADPISQKAAEAAPAAVPSSPANPPLNAESQGESLVATAGTAWPVSPNSACSGVGHHMVLFGDEILVS